MVKNGKPLGFSVTIMVVGIVWLSLTVVPSSAQSESLGLPQCWTKIVNCLATAQIDMDDPEADFGICCPVIKPQLANTACFCSIKEYSESIPSDDDPSVAASETELEVNRLLAGCKLDTTYDQLCISGTSKPGKKSYGSGGSSSSGSRAESLTGTARNNAIKIASVGLLPGALVVLTMIMS